MFWSLVLEPGKRYSSTVTESFHLSAAAVDTKTLGKSEAGIFPVQVKVDGQEVILCNLSNQCLFASVDLFFDKGAKLTFMTTGKATIHLTGYTAADDGSSEDEGSNDEDSESSDLENIDEIKDTASFHRDFKGGKKDKSKKDGAEKRKSTSGEVVAAKKRKVGDAESSDEDDISGDEFGGSDLGDFSFSDDDDENDDEVGDDEEEDVDDMSEDDSDAEDSDSEEDVPTAKKKKKTEPQPQNTPKSKKEQPVPNKKQDKTPGSPKKAEKLNKSISQEQTNGALTKSEKKAQKKSLSQAEVKTPKGNESVASSSQSPKQQQSMEGGVMVEELKAGNGAVAKPGKMLAVYYTGRLKKNNRVFDQSTSGAGFKFRLGRGEVIKGWDVALNGMKVGSKRRITCPPAMAYGAQGSPPAIPPNSALIFDIELRSVH